MSNLTALRLLRRISFAEGLSWLLLLAAMGYRAASGHHEPVRWTGGLHGVLFCIFAAALALAFWKMRWSLRVGFLLFVSALVPLGFILAERFLKREVQQREGSEATEQ